MQDGAITRDVVVVNPERMAALGSDEASAFCLVTNRRYADRFRIEPSARHAQSMVLTFDEGEEFQRLLADDIPEGAHILTILPDCLLHSIPREVLGRRKLLIMACRSGRTNLEGVQHFLRVGERTDPAEQEAFAARFFEKGEAAPYFEIVNERYGTSARFDHLSDIYEWHEQLGRLDWGDQQVYPAGEIACFLVPLKIERLQPEIHFAVTGAFALKGQPIVQSGPPSFLIEDQERIYQRLATMRDHAVIIDVVEGDVTAARASDPVCAPAAAMLDSLFEVDSRFRRIYEIGFAINRHLELWPGNTAMNEVYGGTDGTLHVGLGMLPHTQYHFDIFCEGTKVLGKDGEVVFGGEGTAPRKMHRQRAAACPCTSY
jgi:hypothetical protein